eukprot:1863445-Rhodomonas_salina.2
MASAMFWTCLCGTVSGFDIAVHHRGGVSDLISGMLLADDTQEGRRDSRRAGGGEVDRESMQVRAPHCSLECATCCHSRRQCWRFWSRCCGLWRQQHGGLQRCSLPTTPCPELTQRAQERGGGDRESEEQRRSER